MAPAAAARSRRAPGPPPKPTTEFVKATTKRAASGPRHVRNLIGITAIVGLPYGLWVGYLWLHLQSTYGRPAVAVNASRQLLIVGTQSSGTTDVTKRLQALGLEVEHESSDSAWTFARDGTVSWMHCLRFMPGVADAAQLDGLCGESRRNMGFHPAMFRVPRRGCSYRSQWDACWRSECSDIVSAEWGCARRGECETPFARGLLQVRHPLRVIESLVVKFCNGHVDGTPHQYVVQMLASLWPPDRAGASSGVPWQRLGCVPLFAWYWTLYNEQMLQAHADGLLASWFRVEDAPDACTIAKAAGFLDAHTAVSVEHAHAAAIAACTSDGVLRDNGGAGRARRNANSRNKGQVSLRLDDVLVAAGDDVEAGGLAPRLLRVAEALGYESSTWGLDEYPRA